eukprot:CAMPEP_0197312264 /NCGR_PEP_ID=MMETSP0891-20130614/18707_1 /TAXON_ID=44058 ORGANISM="Aureoumbra lagunensis, Strain CCMP1510" /NCGR_SAMPLE_ID=MMETSP0891 /ASSEMBLY_ACC=CAM_ASM_000534 /LENGTH=621 /DNA_ID=CAMNT_0042799237 /DNA_START=9 /DNA_END=1874 /DNA_ORIENTATION=+
MEVDAVGIAPAAPPPISNQDEAQVQILSNMKKKRRPTTKKKGRDNRGQVQKKAKKSSYAQDVVKLSPVIIINLDDVSLSSWLSDYNQVPRCKVIKRMLFISRRSQDTRQRLAFARSAALEAKKGLDTRLYREAVSLWSEACTKAKVPNTEAIIDEKWIESTDYRSRTIQERLELELSSKRSACGTSTTTNIENKEAVVLAFAKLGDFLLARGDGSQALKHYVRMRDYATSLDHTAQVCRTIAACAAVVGNWSQVLAYVNKAQMLQDSSQSNTNTENINPFPESQLYNNASIAWLEIAAAFASLESKKYQQCAEKLVAVLGQSNNGNQQIKSQLGGSGAMDVATSHSWELCAWRDIAAYASLLAIATLDRSQLRSLCTEHARFKNRVKQIHPKALEILLAVHSGKYHQALNDLTSLRDEMLLDPILASHAFTLYQMCTDRCLAQFCAPYAIVSLESTAQALGIADIKLLENKLCKLIARGILKAKIDAASGLIISFDQNSKQFDTSAIVTHNILRNGNKFLREIDALLLRLSCLEHDFVVRATTPTSGSSHDFGSDHPRQGRPHRFDSRERGMDPSSFYNIPSNRPSLCQDDDEFDSFARMDSSNMQDVDDLMSDAANIRRP